MRFTYGIDPAVLNKAAEWLAVIDDAGYGPRFDDVLAERMADQEVRDERNHLHHWLTRNFGSIHPFTDRLSELLECPREQALGVAIERFVRRSKREEVLKLLEEMAGEIQRKQSSHRRAFSREERS